MAMPQANYQKWRNEGSRNAYMVICELYLNFVKASVKHGGM